MKKFTKLEICEMFIITFLLTFSLSINNARNERVNVSVDNIDAMYIDNEYTDEELTTRFNELTEIMQDISTRLDAEVTSSNSRSAVASSLTDKNNANNIFLKTYPVGSIYISYNSANPGTVFGGTWEAFAGGRTIIGIDTSNTKFDTIGETGGVNTISYTPAGTVGGTALTVDQIPAHTHGSASLSGWFRVRRFSASAGNTSGTNIVQGVSGIVTKANYTWSGTHANINTNSISGKTPLYDRLNVNATHEHTSVGSGGAHNHTFSGTAASIDARQPYISVYMWRRTA